ncbi:MAG: hypothetical protein IT371_14315 [Deltaproteobacteria bacterium]|nr:hypothetical protein [Deltaproteobacteria bacterium]
MSDFELYDTRDTEDEQQFLARPEPITPYILPPPWWTEVRDATGRNARLVLAEKFRIAERRIVEDIERGDFMLSRYLVVSDENGGFVLRSVLFGEVLTHSGQTREAPRHRLIQRQRAVLTPIAEPVVLDLCMSEPDVDAPMLGKENAGADVARCGHRTFKLSDTAEVPLELASRVLRLCGRGVRTARTHGQAARVHKLRELDPTEVRAWRAEQSNASEPKRKRGA